MSDSGTRINKFLSEVGSAQDDKQMHLLIKAEFM